MSTTRYWLATPATKIWFLFLILGCITTWALTIDHYKLRSELKALDFAIAEMVIKAGSDFCHKIKAKNFMARYDLGSASSGCVK